MKQLVLTLFVLLSCVNYVQAKGILSDMFPLSPEELKQAQQGNVDMQFKAYMHFKHAGDTKESIKQERFWLYTLLDKGHREAIESLYVNSRIEKEHYDNAVKRGLGDDILSKYSANKVREYLLHKGYATNNLDDGVLEFEIGKALSKNTNTITTAYELLKKAHSKKYPNAESLLNSIDKNQLSLGYVQQGIFYSQRVPPNHERYEELVVTPIKKADELKNPDAMYILARIYLNPQYKKASDTWAWVSMRQAADAGHTQAQLEIGNYSLAHGMIGEAERFLIPAFDTIIKQGKKDALKNQVIPQLKRIPAGSEGQFKSSKERDKAQRLAHELIQKLEKKLQ